MSHLQTGFDCGCPSYSGCIGSGLCILSKWPIVNNFMHRFALNSFAYHVFEGDWFAGKGVGLCELEVEDMTVNVYTLHVSLGF